MCCVRLSGFCFSWAQQLFQRVLRDTPFRAGHEIRCGAQRQNNLLWVDLTVSAKKKKKIHEGKMLTTLSLQKRKLTTLKINACLSLDVIPFLWRLWKIYKCDFKIIFCFFVITPKPLSKNHGSKGAVGVVGMTPDHYTQLVFNCQVVLWILKKKKKKLQISISLPLSLLQRCFSTVLLHLRKSSENWRLSSSVSTAGSQVIRLFTWW